MTDYEITSSEISTYKQCKRKWYLGYYKGLKKNTSDVMGPLPLGTRVHKALEMYYREGIHPLETYRQIVADEGQLAAETVYDMDAYGREVDLGRIMLEGYVAWVTEEAHDADLEVISTEEKLSYKLPHIGEEHGDTVSFIGKIDLRVRNKMAGTRAVLDFKTAASFNDWYNLAHIQPQLKGYMLLDRLTNTDKDSWIDGGIYRLLRKVKRTAKAVPPFYDDVYIHHNEETLRTFWYQLNGVISDMYATRRALDNGAEPQYTVYPAVSQDCQWRCDFLGVCALMDDGSNVEDSIYEKFHHEDPYAYYQEK